MSWTEVRIETDSAHAEILSDALMEAGAVSASIEDAHGGAFAENDASAAPGARDLVVDEPGYATPLWSDCAVLALFDEAGAVAAAVRQAAKAARMDTNIQYSVKNVADQDWVRNTQSQFPPISISKRLWVVPSWHTPPQADAINLVLDPGQAFGTGSHPTTKLCLQWLDENLMCGEENDAPAPYAGVSVLDYGCGSGILAIAAAKLGAVRVAGVDIDERAVATAIDNAQRNGVRVEFFAADTPLDEARHGPFDVCVANILANPLKVLAPLIARATRRGGAIVLSGILDSQGDDVVQAYAPWARLTVFRREQEWVCLAGARNQ
jgi:ribosomal protein L11 methyltransferase